MDARGVSSWCSGSGFSTRRVQNRLADRVENPDFMKATVSCQFEVPHPDLSLVGGIVGRLLGFLRDQGIDDAKFLSELELAATEGMNNAIEHGCSGVEDAFIRVALEIFAGWSAVGDRGSLGFHGLERGSPFAGGPLC